MHASLFLFSGRKTPLVTDEPKPVESVVAGTLNGPPCDESEHAPTVQVEATLGLEARIAARQDDAESLDLLTTVLRRPISGFDEQGRTLLFYAVRGNRDDGGKAQASAAAVAKKLLGAAAQWDEVPRYLVQRHNFDVNFPVKASGMTPLMEATRFGNVFGVELLLELRADPHHANTRGHTALEIARSKVPEYLDFQEMQCSENRITSVKESIERDRQRIAKMLKKLA